MSIIQKTLSLICKYMNLIFGFCKLFFTLSIYYSMKKIKTYKAPKMTALIMYLAAACRPDALCTSTTSVTKRETDPLPVFPSGLTGRCLYRMHTSSRPKKHNTSVPMFQLLNMPACYLTINLCVCVPEGFVWCSVGLPVPGMRGRENMCASLGCCLCMVTMAHSLDNGRIPLATSWSRTFG